ncbi:hypothetical protein G8770_21175 [Aestuariicella hydrocarbonica]|uniref:Uncharacterized protein n=1 Tax=Pseudomaricurvus hydrocarbonicus TaxID=1470433 RepID=A0A9E5MPG7_9GAMM|nr:hypothetical protein [Aestuariicella hydrocarbonica]NHO68068.1 hypothetical protein [Aestuariicella hydrocarbonica]
MKISTIRKLVTFTILVLIISQILSVVMNVFSIVGVIAMVLVYGYCAYRAKDSAHSSMWFIVPTLFFSLTPVVIALWPDETVTSVGDYLLTSLRQDFALITGFLIPVVLLCIVDFALKSHALVHNSVKTSPGKSQVTAGDSVTQGERVDERHEHDEPAPDKYPGAKRA